MAMNARRRLRAGVSTKPRSRAAMTARLESDPCGWMRCGFERINARSFAGRLGIALSVPVSEPECRNSSSSGWTEGNCSNWLGSTSVPGSEPERRNSSNWLGSTWSMISARRTRVAVGTFAIPNHVLVHSHPWPKRRHWSQRTPRST
jgi:hypothetical protein